MARIASLLPSATEIAYALGLGDRVVGVSHGCDHPSAARTKPVLTRPRFVPDGLSSGEVDAAVREALREFGSVYEVDTERLAAVGPDLLLTQGVCEVCAVPTRDAEAAALLCSSMAKASASLNDQDRPRFDNDLQLRQEPKTGVTFERRIGEGQCRSA